jgi:hypothetical protein
VSCKDDKECSFKRIWKETVLGYFKVLSQHSPPPPPQKKKQLRITTTNTSQEKHDYMSTALPTTPRHLVGEWLQADKSEKFTVLITVYLLTI